MQHPWPRRGISTRPQPFSDALQSFVLLHDLLTHQQGEQQTTTSFWHTAELCPPAQHVDPTHQQLQQQGEQQATVPITSQPNESTAHDDEDIIGWNAISNHVPDVTSGQALQEFCRLTFNLNQQQHILQ